MITQSLPNLTFPTLRARNLQRDMITLPAELRGELNLGLIAFQQWQQRLIDTWLPFARQLEAAQPNLCYYEFPVIQSLNVLARTFINEGMRAGIPDPTARERTITLYTDKEAFRRSLGLLREETIYAVLFDRQGRVYWRAEGEFTAEQGASLQAALEMPSP